MNCLKLLPIGLCLIFSACGAQRSDKTTEIERLEPSNVYAVEKIMKSDEEWKKELDELEYKVLRHEGTERAFSGDLWDHKGKGDYVCRGCALPLFKSTTKFKSGTGWPSYYEPIRSEHITEYRDNKYGWNRVEVRCARCDGHLGHVFDDGPKPTGLRYCINSASLDFSSTDQKTN